MTQHLAYPLDQRPMFPHTIDSTMLATLRSCGHKYLRQYVQHWKPQAQSVHLVAGGAFASGIEAARDAYFVKGESAEDAQAAGLIALIKHYGDFECPPESNKSLERMCGALEFYFEQYPLGGDGAVPIELANGRRGIEFSFAEPIDVLHPVTGAPILFSGRSDMIATRAGRVFGYDEKTTSSLGGQWGRQWEMRSQFTGYCWAAAKQGIKMDGVIVRGVSILKTKYDTLEVPTYRTGFDIARWYAQMCRDLERAKRMWEEGYWDFSLDGACTEYGGCSFTKVCKSAEPEAWLPVEFVQRVWDPLERKELSVADHEAAWGHVRAAGEAPPAGLKEKAEPIGGFKELMEASKRS